MRFSVVGMATVASGTVIEFITMQIVEIGCQDKSVIDAMADAAVHARYVCFHLRLRRRLIYTLQEKKQGRYFDDRSRFHASIYPGDMICMIGFR